MKPSQIYSLGMLSLSIPLIIINFIDHGVDGLNNPILWIAGLPFLITWILIGYYLDKKYVVIKNMVKKEEMK